MSKETKISLPHVCKKDNRRVILRSKDIPSKPNRVKVNAVKTDIHLLDRVDTGKVPKAFYDQIDTMSKKQDWSESDYQDSKGMRTLIDYKYKELKDAKDTSGSVANLCNRIDTYKPQKEKESPKEETKEE